MQIRSLRLIAFFLASSPAVMAQLSARSDVLVLNSWRTQFGDDVSWSQPDLEDSTWQQSRGPLRQVPLVVESGYRWFRTTVDLPPSLAGRDLAIGMGPSAEVYEIFVDGVSIGRFGHWTPTPASPFDRNLTFSIPPGVIRGPTVHLAVRTWVGKTTTNFFPFYMSGASRFVYPPELGLQSTIFARSQLRTSTGIVRNLPWGVCFFLMAVAGVIALVLFAVQRSHFEYLFLGLYGVSSALAPLAGGLLAEDESIMRRSIGPAMVVVFYMLSHSLGLAFTARLTPRFRRWIDFCAVVYVLVGFAIAFAMHFQAGYVTLTFWVVVSNLPMCCYVLSSIGLFLDRKPGSLAIAASLLAFQLATEWVNLSLSPNVASDLRMVPFGPFAVDIRAVFQVLFVLATLVVLSLRYRDEQFHQVALETDMASARRMREQLLGRESVTAAGFVVEAAYLPAREVGGDFYRTVALSDGSLLVAVGDVSGKGLDAAMLVAAVLGSLANETERSPASLLGYLNRALCGRTGGGFITACCARIYPNGRIVVANAGHIPPYLNNRELEIENGLPLGLTPEATYAETELHAGGTLTFVSDGVVEARDATGQLLGFDRMTSLTSQSAAEIAGAAQRWGQEDDITVLRVTFAA